jgi:hypothetical protein
MNAEQSLKRLWAFPRPVKARPAPLVRARIPKRKSLLLLRWETHSVGPVRQQAAAAAHTAGLVEQDNLYRS